MTHQETIVQAYRDCGMVFVLRDDPRSPGTTYLVLAGTHERQQEYEDMPLPELLTRAYIEFEHGQIASY